MVGLDKLMKEWAMKTRNRVELSYLDSKLFDPEQTDIQKEYNLTNKEHNIRTIEF